MTPGRGVAFLIAALALAACGQPKPPRPPAAYETVQPSVCTLATFPEVSTALGAPPVGSTDTADHGALNPGCSWMSDADSFGRAPRMLVLTVWRKAALDMQGQTMSGAALYKNEADAILEEFGAAQPVRGVGDEAVIGYIVETGGLLRARFVARKGTDVLTMQLTGADRDAFEAIAAKVVKAM